MNLKIKKLHPDAIVPQYATDGAACFDLHSVDDVTNGRLMVDPCIVFRTGPSFEVPPGHVMLIFSRSGHGFRHDVRLANCVGVIDSDYRGEVLVKLTADWRRGDTLYVNNGDRIAQALVIPYPRVTFEVVDELSDTQRGAGGFGSTGA
jgi:dUTP pyrophosphatase